MASAESFRMGQNHLCCQKCNLNAKLEYKCIRCKLLLCQECDKSHREATGHFVMYIKDVGIHRGNVDFSNLKCDPHSSPVCSYCTKCDAIVCPECVKDVHKEHRMYEINEGYDLVVVILKNNKEDFEEHLSNLMSLTNNLTQLKKVYTKKMADELLKIQLQDEKLKRTNDKLTKEIEEEGKTALRAIDDDLDKLKNLKRDAEEMLESLQAQIQNTDAVTFFKFGCEFKSRVISVPTLPSLYLTLPELKSGKVDRSYVEKLKTHQNTLGIKEKSFEHVDHYITDLGFIGAICPCTDGTMWLSDCTEERVQRVKPNGQELNVLNTISVNVNDIKVFSSTQVLLSLEGESKLKLMNISGGEMIDSIYDVRPFQARNFNMVGSNEVIVRAKNFSSDKVAIFLIDSQGKRQNVYQGDIGYDSLFVSPLSIAMTSNRLIHIVDCQQGSNVGKVAVINENGELQNVYCGHPQVNRDVTFRPEHLAVTPNDDVLVVDTDSHFLHLLDNCGQLLSFFNGGKVGIIDPISLTFSSNGTLYIGCSTYEDSDEKAELHVCRLNSSSI